MPGAGGRGVGSGHLRGLEVQFHKVRSVLETACPTM